MCACNLVVAVTGSIAAYKACAVVSELVRRGHRVRVVATASALRFVGAASFEGLTGEPVRTDLWAAGGALDHIELTRWADAVLVCPATANTLNRLAAGLADDLLGALFLAHDRTKPWVVAPAMNPSMWRHPATEAAVRTLAGWGVTFLPVAAGRTACGEIGEGRLLAPDEIVERLEAALARPARRLRVLVTGGGTAESVDAVRVLTNLSTGATGALLADHCWRAGHEVLFVRARSAVRPATPCAQETFGSFAELDEVLDRRLGGADFDVAIHAAAVGDFAVEKASRTGKLDSDAPAALRLRPQPKLVDGLRQRSRNPALVLVAFKLTAGADAAAAGRAVAALQRRARPDFVVHNDLSRQGAGGEFPAEIYAADGSVAARCATREELAVAVVDLIAAAVGGAGAGVAGAAAAESGATPPLAAGGNSA